MLSSPPDKIVPYIISSFFRGSLCRKCTATPPGQQHNWGGGRRGLSAYIYTLQIHLAAVLIHRFLQQILLIYHGANKMHIAIQTYTSHCIPPATGSLLAWKSRYVETMNNTFMRALRNFWCALDSTGNPLALVMNNDVGRITAWWGGAFPLAIRPLSEN